jgi:hypothetical protein
MLAEEDEPSINPDGTTVTADAPGNDLIIPRDMDSDLFDDYVKVYNATKPEDRETNEALAELAAAIIEKYFGEKKVQWGSDGVEVMDDQLIFKNFSSSEDTAPEGGEGLNEGVYHAAMSSVSEGRFKEPKYLKDPPLSAGKGGFKEGDIVSDDEGGTKYRIYNISPNWAALKDVNTDEKTMVPIGDLYEFYQKVSKK